MRVGAQEQMPYFVCDCQSKNRQAVSASLFRQPLHAVDEHRREPSLAGACVNEGVPELEHPVGIRLRR